MRTRRVRRRRGRWSPRLDRATFGSAWFSTLSQIGVTIAVQPIEREALPRWIAARLARQNQRASDEVLTYLAERSEGNLLAARQEIEKLALVLAEGEISLAAVDNATTDVARYDVFQASEAWLAGDADRSVRILNALESKGEPVTLAIWQMTEDLRAIASVHAATRHGVPVAAAARNARVWGRRQSALEKAVRRITPERIGALIIAVAHLDALAKGLTAGNPWEDLVSVALDLCGTPSRPLNAAFSANV